jgi:hypothetical protein
MYLEGIQNFYFYMYLEGIQNFYFSSNFDVFFFKFIALRAIVSIFICWDQKVWISKILIFLILTSHLVYKNILEDYSEYYSFYQFFNCIFKQNDSSILYGFHKRPKILISKVRIVYVSSILLHFFGKMLIWRPGWLNELGSW